MEHFLLDCRSYRRAGLRLGSGIEEDDCHRFGTCPGWGGGSGGPSSRKSLGGSCSGSGSRLAAELEVGHRPVVAGGGLRRSWHCCFGSSLWPRIFRSAGRTKGRTNAEVRMDGCFGSLGSWFGCLDEHRVRGLRALLEWLFRREHVLRIDNSISLAVSDIVDGHLLAVGGRPTVPSAHRASWSSRLGPS